MISKSNDKQFLMERLLQEFINYSLFVAPISQ